MWYTWIVVDNDVAEHCLMARLLTYIASSRDMKILTSFEAGKALAAFLLLVVSPIVASGQQVSILNPTDLIPGFGGDDEKDFEDRWYFWLIIGLVAAFSIVVAFFVGRGVWKWRKNKKRWEGVSHNDSLVHEEEETTIGNGASNSLADGISRGGVDADKSEEQKRNDETLSNEVRAMSKLGTASCDIEKGNRHDDVVVPVDMEDLRRRVGHRGHHRRGSSGGGAWTSQGSSAIGAVTNSSVFGTDLERTSPYESLKSFDVRRQSESGKSFSQGHPETALSFEVLEENAEQEDTKEESSQR